MTKLSIFDLYEGTVTAGGQVTIEAVLKTTCRASGWDGSPACIRISPTGMVSFSKRPPRPRQGEPAMEPTTGLGPVSSPKNRLNEDRRRDVSGAPGATMNARRNVRAPQWSLRRPQAPFARGSRVTVSPAPGLVINGPPCSGAASVKATSGISLALPANGNSFRSGKNG